MKKLAALALMASLVGCASSGGMMKVEEDAADFPTLVKQAKAAIKQASSIGGEWRDSKKFLEKAEEAEKAGDHEKAMKLAKKAKKEGELGYQQAMGQKDAGPWMF